MRARICSMISSTLTESERTLKSDIWLEGLVNEQHHRESPQGHTDQERAVGDDQLGRASAPLPLMYELEVPEDPVYRKRNRQPEPLRVELLLGLGADGVEHIGD